MIKDLLDAEMAKIDYGWLDKDGGRHERLHGFKDGYILQTPDELRESRLGVCWDQVELERDILERSGIDAHAYFVVYYNGAMDPSHTFILFENDGKVVWYEHAWEKHRGWHEFDSFEDALRDVREKFIEMELSGVELNPMNLCIYEYEAPTQKLSCMEFYSHCGAGKSVNEDL